MNTTYCMLLTAGLLAATPAMADREDDERPIRDATSAEQMRERPADARSRYPDTRIDQDEAARGNIEPPHEGSAMDMNDDTDDPNDSRLEMPRRR